MLSKEERFYKSTVFGIHVYPGYPGIGKTYGLINHIKDNLKGELPRNILTFSSDHDHLDEIGLSLQASTTQHLKGFKLSCFMYKYHKKLLERYYAYGDPKDTVCVTCGSKYNCTYKRQYNFLDPKNESDIRTVLAPLEFINLQSLRDWANEAYVDESIEKLSYRNIGITRQSKIDMYRTVQRIGNDKNYDTDFLLEQIDIAYDIIITFQSFILEQGSLLLHEDHKVLDEFNPKTYKDDAYIIQKRKYITHPVKIEPITTQDFEEKLDQFQEFDYKEDLFHLIKIDIDDELIPVFINFPDQIKAIRELVHIYQRKKEAFPINVNEKIEYRDTVDEGDIYYKKEDGSYLASTIGKSYTSDKRKLIEHQQDSYITFGVHMMHTVFELAETHPVKLLDSSFNRVCFNKLLNEYQSDNEYHIPIEIVETKVEPNLESHIYQMLTRRNKYQSHYSKTSQGVADGQPPNAKCLRDIKDINAFGRQAKREGLTVGIITFMELEKYFWGVFGKKMVKHFRHFRGSNRLEKADILIVFGTLYHPPKIVLLDYINTFHEFPRDITPIMDDHGRFDGYVDKELNEFFQWHVMEEMYQAMHRIRILLHDKIVILFGAIPQRIIDNKECTIEKPQTFRSLQAKLLDTKRYYLHHQTEAREQIVPELDYSLDMMQDYMKTIFLLKARDWSLPLEDTKEVVLNAFKPIMNKILKTLEGWKEKEPNVSNITDAVQKKSRYKTAWINGKAKTVKCKGYNKKQIYFAIALLEQEDKIEVKTVKWVRGGGGERKLLILKT